MTQFETATETCSCGASIELSAYVVDSIIADWRKNHRHIERDAHLERKHAELSARLDRHIDRSIFVEQRVTTLEQRSAAIEQPYTGTICGGSGTAIS